MSKKLNNGIEKPQTCEKLIAVAIDVTDFILARTYSPNEALMVLKAVDMAIRKIVEERIKKGETHANIH